MSNQERGLLFRIEQLEENQRVLSLNLGEMKRQLQDALSQLHRQFDEISAPPAAPVEVVNGPPESVSCSNEIQPQPTQVQSHEYQLVFDRSGSRAVLIEALEKAQKRLIIVCPWLSRNSIDADLMQKFRDCLNRNCRIDIGWGYLSGRGKTGKGWGNSALENLRQLEQDCPKQFKLKLLVTHEKFLICDSSFAMLGSHNMLSSNAQGVIREVGIRTTDIQIIQGLINRFDGAFDAESLEVQDIGEESDVILMNLDNREADQDIDDFPEDEQRIAVDVEEFLRRYEAGERDFTGVNLTGANLIGASLTGVNLSKANLTRAKLNSANLRSTNLSRTNLSEANLIQATLNNANLSGANLRSAELSAANLCGAKLAGTNLNGAKLIQAQMNGADLSEANLNYTNLTAASLQSANLMKANLKGTNLAAADLYYSDLRYAEFNDKTRLSGANLNLANLAGQNLQKMNMSGVNMSGANLCGTLLCFSNLSGADFTSADLRGADLGSTNLEKANLKGAQLSGANLDEAKLSGAIMPDGTVHE